MRWRPPMVRGARWTTPVAGLNFARSNSGEVADGARRLAAIMFTDMVGYTALMQADETAALKVLERHNRLLRPVFARFGGREIKTVGDAFLVEFESALDAVHAAIELQRSLHEYNAASTETWKIRIRIGIHLGDVVRSDGDVLGDAVNIASRIEPLAEPEGICLTQQVYDQVQNKLTTPLVKLPPRELKNIQLPVGVYKVARTWLGEGSELSAAGPDAEHHLAVLPLSNISAEPADAYFADGLTEELISVLSQVPGLGVIARTSVMPYKTAPKSVAQVGAELAVESVLEGSVRKAGNRIRITLQLIDVATQRHIWASSYNREVDDVFAVQSDIAESTAEALRLRLAARSTPGGGRRLTSNPEAYDLYLRGLVAATEPGERLAEAVRCFTRATELDPAFAEAFAAWAGLYVVAAGDSIPMRDVMPKARELVARALQLDPDSSEAHASLANITFQSDHDWARAEAEFRTAIALNPSNVRAHQFLGLMLIALGRFDEATELLQRAVRLDPGGTHRMTLALAAVYAGKFDEAIAYVDEALERDPSSNGLHIIRGMFCLAAGRLSEARREADVPPGNSPDGPYDHALLNALVGRPETGRAYVATVERGEAKTYISDTHLAMLCAALGERERALGLLEKALREGDAVLWLYYRGPWFDSVWGDPRFVALLHTYDLPTDPRPRPPSSASR